MNLESQLEETHLDYKPSMASIVLKRMWQLRMGVFGFALVLVLGLAAIFASQVATHDPLEQDILARLTPPIFLVPTSLVVIFIAVSSTVPASH
jgi:hypothetical protein